MRLRRVFWMTFSFFLLLWGFSAYSATRSEEIQKIDLQIQDLEEQKRGYEARALRHEDKAEYMQFQQQSVLETRRHLELAEENRNKAALVQKEIDRLIEKRNKLQK